MARGKKTGGRKRGSLNKRTLARLHAAALHADGEAVRKALRDGTSPLTYLLGVVNDPSVDPERRDRCAAAALPFCHSKLAHVDPRNLPGQPAAIDHRIEIILVEPRRQEPDPPMRLVGDNKRHLRLVGEEPD